MKIRSFRSRSISREQEEFEDVLARAIVRANHDISYEKARRILAESQGALQYEAEMKRINQERSRIDRFFRWLGL